MEKISRGRKYLGVSLGNTTLLEAAQQVPP